MQELAEGATRDGTSVLKANPQEQHHQIEYFSLQYGLGLGALFVVLPKLLTSVLKMMLEARCDE